MALLGERFAWNVCTGFFSSMRGPIPAQKDPLTWAHDYSTTSTSSSTSTTSATSTTSTTSTSSATTTTATTATTATYY